MPTLSLAKTSITTAVLTWVSSESSSATGEIASNVVSTSPPSNGSSKKTFVLEPSNDCPTTRNPSIKPSNWFSIIYSTDVVAKPVSIPVFTPSVITSIDGSTWKPLKLGSSSSINRVNSWIPAEDNWFPANRYSILSEVISTGSEVISAAKSSNTTPGIAWPSNPICVPSRTKLAAKSKAWSPPEPEILVLRGLLPPKLNTSLPSVCIKPISKSWTTFSKVVGVCPTSGNSNMLKLILESNCLLPLELHLAPEHLLPMFLFSLSVFQS